MNKLPGHGAVQYYTITISQYQTTEEEKASVLFELGAWKIR